MEFMHKKSLKHIAVYCGCNFGNKTIYREMTAMLAQAMAAEGITLVYGGAISGLMGMLADEMLRKGGKVIGVIPQALVEVEVAHEHLTALYMVDSMHERKAKISDLAEGFILLPGGVGSLEEFFEMITWGQLNYHKKPLGILNINGYYDAIINFLHYMVDEGFFKKEYLNMIYIDEVPKKLLDKMSQHIPQVTSKWIEDPLL